MTNLCTGTKFEISYLKLISDTKNDAECKNLVVWSSLCHSIGSIGVTSLPFDRSIVGGVAQW